MTNPDTTNALSVIEEALREISYSKIMTEQGLKDETDENTPFGQLSREQCLTLLHHQRGFAKQALSLIQAIRDEIPEDLEYDIIFNQNVRGNCPSTTAAKLLNKIRGE